MRKQMSLFVWAIAVFGMSSVWAATNSGMSGASSADLTGAPGTRARTAVNYEKYETRSTSKTYTVKDGKDMYYTEPAKKSDAYRNTSSSANAARTTTRAETARSEAKRKYYLAHPFFQPLKGKIGSVTDLSYTMSSYDFDIDQTAGPALSDTKAKWDMKQFAIKEDLSYGITDRLAVLGMLQYDSSKYKMDWSDPATPDDEMSDSGLNLLGLGVQWRFADTDEWIATLSGYYQRQVDIANIFIADLKAGYKAGSSTIYGLTRGWLVNFDGNSYGNGIESDEAALFIAYKTGDKTATYFEIGAGVFSVLDEDWTLNLELVFGNYDWHNQASIKGAIGWQPGTSFALNLYAKTAIYDSADGKNLDFWFYEPAAGINDFTKIGTAGIDNYSETTVGVQAILYF